METNNYSIDHEPISNILSYIKTGQVAIPEMQRPFVWTPKQITQLIDSLYKDLPTGFIVLWENDKTRLKDGSLSKGKKIIIDGQQRITALRSALLGEEVVTEAEDYNSKSFVVAYDLYNEKFETHKPSHDKSKRWIPDISIFFKDGALESEYDFVNSYYEDNKNLEGITPTLISNRIRKIKSIVNREIGIVKLSQHLSIAEATNIFNLMNREGTKLGQEDYIMAKLSSNTKYDGQYVWKTIDYFCKGVRDKKWILDIPKEDEDFYNTEYYKAIKWLGNTSNNFIYVPTYNDILRVVYGVGFKNGILKRLSELIDGRNFEDKTIDEAVTIDTFSTIKEILFEFVNENNYKSFNLCIEETGFKYRKLINSQSAIDMAYIVWILLKETKAVMSIERISYTQKWYILSILTKRYSGSSETIIDKDIRNIEEKGFINYFNEIERSELNNNFWNITLFDNFDTTYTLSPGFLVYTAAQIKNKAKSLFTPNDIDSLIKIKVDVHHLFPKAYLKSRGIVEQKNTNQICNYVYLESYMNKYISDKSPKVYFNEILDLCIAGKTEGVVKNKTAFLKTLDDNCIPRSILEYDYKNYFDFLDERTKLITKYIKNYYKSL